MKIQGKISRVLPVRTGPRQDGTQWEVLPFIVSYKESPEQRGNDHVLLEVFDINQRALVKEGAEVKAEISLSVREWNGKRFNNVNLWQLEFLGSDAPSFQQDIYDENGNPLPL